MAAACIGLFFRHLRKISDLAFEPRRLHVAACRKRSLLIPMISETCRQLHAT